MSVTTRRRSIQDMILQHGESNLGALAERFQVSEMTIRRDLEALESQGALRRLAGGGAIAVPGKTQEPTFEARALQESEGKAHIGAAVADLLQPGEAVYFDGGSTSLAAARALRRRGLGLTVVTASLLVVLELVDEPGTETILIGGSVRPGELTTFGPEMEEGLRHYHVDTYVMGVAGLHPRKGLTEYHGGEGHGKRAAIDQADRVIVALDQTKLDRVLLVHVADLDRVHILVTDAPRHHKTIAAVSAQGIQVVSVSESDAVDADIL